jgi:hypothetical protein
MGIVLRLLVVVGLMLVWASPVAAEDDGDIPCTWDWQPSNESWQTGSGGLWLKYEVQTWLKLLPCQIGAFVEAKVDGVAGSFLREDGLLGASAVKEVPVPYPGTWHVQGRHSRGSVFGEIFLGVTYSHADIHYHSEPEPSTGDSEPDLASGDPSCDGCVSPLLIDTDGNGIKLTTAERGVIFDIDGDGQAEQIGWTREDSGDAWLAMDRNGNGVIDDGTELFGNFTPVRPGQAETAANGFDALNFLHSESVGLAALDSMIAANDAAWARLLLWRDANHNGVSEPEELTRVVDSPLVSIDLRYLVVSKLRKGNEIREVSSVLWGDATRQIVDVWLSVLR